MNLFVAIGRLTRDPESRTTNSGLSLCSFSIAVDRRRKQEGQPTADFFNVTAFGKLGDLCTQYLAKGRKVCVTGAIQIRTYDANDGTKRTAVDVIADSVEFLSPKNEDQPERPAPSLSEFTSADEEPLPF